MKSMASLILGALMFGCVLLVGCNGSGAGSRSQGLLADAGLVSATSVRAVLVGGVCITDAAMIGQLYDAVNDPDRKWASKMARSRQIAFVSTSGQVAYLAYSEAGDLTARQGSSKLMKLLRQVFNNPAYKHTTHVPVGKPVEVRVASNGVTTVSPKSNGRWSSIQQPLIKLLKLWNPNDLKGCQLVDGREIGSLSNRYIEVRLAQPVAFGTLIAPKDFKWWPPPQTVETRIRYNDFGCSTLRVLSTGSEKARLAFKLPGKSDWVLSQEISTKEFLGYGPQGMSQFGPDLFEEVVSEIRKP